MGDSVLVNGLLTRLDAVTAQMGVAATEVWDLWLATAWIGFVQNAVSLAAALALAYFGWWKYQKNEGFPHDDLGAFFWGLCVLVGGLASLVSAVGLLEHFPYLFEPRLYALDQLLGLVGR